MSGYGGKRCGEIMIRYEEEQLRNMTRRNDQPIHLLVFLHIFDYFIIFDIIKK